MLLVIVPNAALFPVTLPPGPSSLLVFFIAGWSTFIEFWDKDTGAFWKKEAIVAVAVVLVRSFRKISNLLGQNSSVICLFFNHLCSFETYTALCEDLLSTTMCYSGGISAVSPAFVVIMNGFDNEIVLFVTHALLPFTTCRTADLRFRAEIPFNFSAA